MCNNFSNQRMRHCVFININETDTLLETGKVDVWIVEKHGKLSILKYNSNEKIVKTKLNIW